MIPSLSSNDVDEESLERARKIFKTNFNSILNNKECDMNVGVLNGVAALLVSHDEKMSEWLKEVLSTHLINVVSPSLVGVTNNDFISKLNNSWKEYNSALSMIRDNCSLFDSLNLSRRRGQSEPLRNLGFILFRDQIINHPTINLRLKTTLWVMIEKQFNKETIELMDLKSIFEMLLELGLGSRDYFEKEFEPFFLQQSADYYHSLSKKILTENNAKSFVEMVENILNKKERFCEYLDKITMDKINEIRDREFVYPKQAQVFVEQKIPNVANMVNNDNIEEIKLFYKLLKFSGNGTTVLSDAMIKFMETQSEKIEKNKKPMEYIHTFFKYQFYYFLRRDFPDIGFKNIIHPHFVNFLNKNTKCSEFLSLYFDQKLKNGSNTIITDDCDVDKAVMLYRFLQEKDIFEKYYKMHFAKRLLLSNKTFDDSEKAIILKLKVECGTIFTSKLEKMLNDVEASQILMGSYKQIKHSGEIDISVKILNKAYWPLKEAEMCHIPASAENAFNRFKKFYLLTYRNRALKLNPSMGFADIKATFYKKEESGQLKEETKLFNVSTYQMCLLMAFNERETYTYKQLLEYTKIPDCDLKRALMSLALSKPEQQILKREGASSIEAEIDGSNIFSVNDDLTSKLTRIRIRPISNKVGESENERKETRANVDNDRKCEIEAAIVRIMKARQKLSHNELITEVIKQLTPRFLPDPSMIKKRIESLIEREYIKRDENDSSYYHYIA